jgi:hypothetical protein
LVDADSYLLHDNLSLSKNVVFTEKLVDTDEAAKTEMMTSSGGFLGVPFTLVVKDDGTKETVVGFDQGKINSVLGIQP